MGLKNSNGTEPIRFMVWLPDIYAASCFLAIIQMCLRRSLHSSVASSNASWEVKYRQSYRKSHPGKVYFYKNMVTDCLKNVICQRNLKLVYSLKGISPASIRPIASLINTLTLQVALWLIFSCIQSFKRYSLELSALWSFKSICLLFKCQQEYMKII